MSKNTAPYLSIPKFTSSPAPPPSAATTPSSSSATPNPRLPVQTYLDRLTTIPHSPREAVRIIISDQLHSQQQALPEGRQDEDPFLIFSPYFENQDLLREATKLLREIRFTGTVYWRREIRVKWVEGVEEIEGAGEPDAGAGEQRD